MHLSIVYLSPLTVLVTNGVLVSWSGGARTKTVAWQSRLSHFWRTRMMTMNDDGGDDDNIADSDADYYDESNDNHDYASCST